MRIGLLLAVGLSLGAAVVPPEAQGQPDNTHVDAVVAVAADYVKGYQRELTAIIADEDYQQLIIAQTPREESMPRVRNLRSEVFFMFAPAADDWMAIRDVAAVNGKEVQDRLNPREALRSTPPEEVAKTFKAHNSRFNLGLIRRNFNEPTLSLLFLDDRYRPNVTFTRKGAQTRSGVTWVTVAFTEKSGPDTLVHDRSGEPAPSKGEFVIDAATGRIRQAWMVTTIGQLTADFTTEYTADSRLGIWVPSRFTEHYVNGARVQNAGDPRTQIRTRFEEIRCLAKYTNYRRFEVKVIIK